MTKYEWERELKNNIRLLPSDEVEKILDYYNELFDDKAERGMSEKEIIREFGNPFDVAHRILNEFDGELLNDEPKSEEYYSRKSDEQRYLRTSDYVDKSVNDKKEPQKNVFSRFFTSFGEGIKSAAGEFKKQFFHTDAEKQKNDRERAERENEQARAEQDRINKDRERTQAYSPKESRWAETDWERSASYSDNKPQKASDTEPAKKKSASSTLRWIFIFPFLILQIVLWSGLGSVTISGFACVVAGAIKGVASCLRLADGMPAFLFEFGTSIGAVGVGIILSIVGVNLCKAFARLTRFYFCGRRYRSDRKLRGGRL